MERCYKEKVSVHYQRYISPGITYEIHLALSNSRKSKDWNLFAFLFYLPFFVHLHVDCTASLFPPVLHIWLLFSGQQLANAHPGVLSCLLRQKKRWASFLSGDIVLCCTHSGIPAIYNSNEVTNRYTLFSWLTLCLYLIQNNGAKLQPGLQNMTALNTRAIEVTNKNKSRPSGSLNCMEDTTNVLFFFFFLKKQKL